MAPSAGLGSYKTAWTLLHKVRAALAHNPHFPLEGDVEVDETYVGGYRPGRNGRGVGKTGQGRMRRLLVALIDDDSCSLLTHRLC
jgi:hypothetical protein